MHADGMREREWLRVDRKRGSAFDRLAAKILIGTNQTKDLVIVKPAASRSQFETAGAERTRQVETGVPARADRSSVDYGVSKFEKRERA